MTKIAVTGGSGKTGRVVASDLRAQGHEVLNLDLGPSPESYHYPAGSPISFMRTDLTDYAPVDEAHVRPESSYALSKDVGEELARQFSRRSGTPILGLRLSNAMIREDDRECAGWQDDPRAHEWNMWGYVDDSHVADAVRRAPRARL